MTKIQNVLSLSTLALVGAIFALPTLSSDANASTTSKLLRCQFNTKHKVVDCCERILRHEKKPFWLHDAGGSCSSVAVCVPGAKQKKIAITHVAAVAKPKCLIKIPSPSTIGGGSPAPAPVPVSLKPITHGKP